MTEPQTAPDLCVVVGATGSFGRAVTERLVKRGQRVLGVGRNEADLAALATEVPGVTTCVADIANDSAIEAIGAALDGPVRMAVFAAGLPIAGSVETVAPGDLARGADIKLGGLLRLVRAVDSRLVPGIADRDVRGLARLRAQAVERRPGRDQRRRVQPDAPARRRLRPPRDHHAHAEPGSGGHAPAACARRARGRPNAGSRVEEQWATYAAGTSLGRLPTPDEIAWAVTMLLDPEADVLHGGVLHLDAGGHRAIT